jgi:hypothetical protein
MKSPAMKIAMKSPTENEKDSHEGSHEDGEAAKGSHEKASHDRKKEKEVSGLFVLG